MNLLRAALLFSVVAWSSAAAAGPAVRFGLTGALVDQGAPSQDQFGPMVALGARLGPILGEVDYAYLSFMDPETIDGGLHRVGVNLRTDVYRDAGRPCLRRIACTQAVNVFVEAGIAMRYGQWALDATTRAPSHSNRQREAHLGAGFGIDNQLSPVRHGWQLGFRFTGAPREDLMIACRGTSCASGSSGDETGGMDLSFLVEWTFLIGR
ncbi:MAG: hypothetical protein M3680_33275 [Myxococcota bacterium]|nr:hypothetical protein [Myxococcota bacterium]